MASNLAESLIQLAGLNHVKIFESTSRVENIVLRNTKKALKCALFDTLDNAIHAQ